VQSELQPVANCQLRKIGRQAIYKSQACNAAELIKARRSPGKVQVFSTLPKNIEIAGENQAR